MKGHALLKGEIIKTYSVMKIDIVKKSYQIPFRQ